MADNKIVHRVSLEGADKVSKQLESIGDIGEKSFKKVKQAADGASSIGKTGEAIGGLGGKTDPTSNAVVLIITHRSFRQNRRRLSGQVRYRKRTTLACQTKVTAKLLQGFLYLPRHLPHQSSDYI